MLQTGRNYEKIHVHEIYKELDFNLCHKLTRLQQWQVLIPSLILAQIVVTLPSATVERKQNLPVNLYFSENLEQFRILFRVIFPKLRTYLPWFKWHV